MSPNMHSYTTLAVLALAVSTASPALSAPVLESEQQARADIDVPLPSGLGSDIKSVLKSIGTNAAFGAIPVAIEHFLGGNSNSTRRALSDEEKRDPGVASLVGDLLENFKSVDGIAKVIGNGILSGVASGAGAFGAGELLNNTRREPSPFSFSDLGGLATTLESVLSALARRGSVQRRDDVSDLINALRLVGRQLDELD